MQTSRWNSAQKSMVTDTMADFCPGDSVCLRTIMIAITIGAHATGESLRSRTTVENTPDHTYTSLISTVARYSSSIIFTNYRCGNGDDAVFIKRKLDGRKELEAFKTFSRELSRPNCHAERVPSRSLALPFIIELKVLSIIRRY